MEYTTHYELNKPELADYAQIDDLNANMDTLDDALFNMQTDISALGSAVKKVSYMNGVLTVTYQNGTVSKYTPGATSTGGMDITITSNDVSFTFTASDSDGNEVAAASADAAISVTGIDAGTYALEVTTDGTVTFDVAGTEITGETSATVTVLTEIVTISIVITEA